MRNIERHRSDVAFALGSRPQRPGLRVGAFGFHGVDSQGTLDDASLNLLAGNTMAVGIVGCMLSMLLANLVGVVDPWTQSQAQRQCDEFSARIAHVDLAALQQGARFGAGDARLFVTRVPRPVPLPPSTPVGCFDICVGRHGISK